MNIYEPAEDSYLLEKHVRRNAFGRVLDMGTGSGIQALTALKNKEVGEVIAVDINKEAVNQLKEKIKQNHLRKITVIQSNLFENVNHKFNTIIFNPPYLPQDKINKKLIEDSALYGGKNGYELSETFFNRVSKFLASDGKIFFLFSSLTNKAKIEEIIESNLFQFKELDQLKISFETLYVYEITKTNLLRELESKLLENIHYFARGKRGVIYTATQDKSKLVKTHLTSKKNIIKVAIKTSRADSGAINRIQTEVNWLKILNKENIGPRFLFHDKNYLVYLFVEGIFILDWVKEHNKDEIKQVLMNLLNQCYIMDKMGVNKEEMHHPLKHVIVTKENQPILLDFERCSRTINPKNVTQFIEFICRLKGELDSKGFNIKIEQLRGLALSYKSGMSSSFIEKVISNII
jgi:release factor glutamine methyltransferase